MSKWAWRAVKTVVVLSAAGLAVSLVEPAQWRAAAGNPSWLLSAIVGWMINQMFCALRFSTLLRFAGAPIAYAEALKITVVGFFVGCIFGGVAATDATRAVLLRQSSDAGIGRLLAVLVLDRGLGVIAFITWGVVFSFMAAAPAMPSPGADAVIASVRTVALVILGGALILFLSLRRGRRLIASLEARQGWLGQIGAALRLMIEPRVALGMAVAFPISVVAVGAIICAQGWIGAQLVGPDADVTAIANQIFLAPASLIISIMPIVPLGMGLGQLTLSGLYVLFGMPAENAVVLATIMQVAQFSVAMLLGLPALLALRRSAPAQRRAREAHLR